MDLYTLIVDYEGGTYVMQAYASSSDTAPSACIEQWDISGISNTITEHDKAIVLKQLKIEEATALTNINNVWYGSVTLSEKHFSFNLILTEIKPEQTNHAHKSISISNPICAKNFRVLQQHKRIDSLSVTNQKTITVALAKYFAALKSVGHLFLWCPTTRTAMKHIISIPDLVEIDILELRQPGKLENFDSAHSLKIFRCNQHLSENDLIEISKLPKLQELSAQYSSVTPKSLLALLDMPCLSYINFEGTDFNDEMASIMMQSTRIEKLDLGATKLTSKGLQYLCKMQQLRALDIWAIDIVEEDLSFLAQLSRLEYLSLGGRCEQYVFTFKGILPHLKNILSLKEIWLDGISITKNEEKALNKAYNHVQVTRI